MKRICVQEANEVEIVFNDRTYLATFNMLSVRYLQEALEETGLKGLPYEHFAALVLYSGIKVNHKDFTVEEATGIILSISPAAVNEIVDEYVVSVNGVGVKENNEELKKVIAQMLAQTGGHLTQKK